MSRQITFTGKVVKYRYEFIRPVINGVVRTWHLHTFSIFVEGEGEYQWIHTGEKKPPIEIGETHTFNGTVAVEIIGANNH